MKFLFAVICFAALVFSIAVLSNNEFGDSVRSRLVLPTKKTPVEELLMSRSIEVAAEIGWTDWEPQSVSLHVKKWAFITGGHDGRIHEMSLFFNGDDWMFLSSKLFLSDGDKKPVTDGSVP